MSSAYYYKTPAGQIVMDWQFNDSDAFRWAFEDSARQGTTIADIGVINTSLITKDSDWDTPTPEMMTSLVDKFKTWASDRLKGLARYNINLDERGDFSATVYDGTDKEVFSISSMEELNQLTEDGFMKHGRDVVGLREYLVNVGMLPRDATLTMDRGVHTPTKSFADRLQASLVALEESRGIANTPQAKGPVSPSL